jgi:hypothetical protein
MTTERKTEKVSNPPWLVNTLKPKFDFPRT